ncbi:ABC transporter permease [Vibrio harveyi]|uniref:ABC transporter permease n=1 Tax=Vibrio harveyi TaxID=669 RepID=UPI0023808D32|nr:ABC transporter permease [Vibrio harveyi]
MNDSKNKPLAAAQVTDKSFVHRKKNSVIFRGKCAALVLILLTFICLFAEGVVNDKPILVHYDGDWFVPIFKSYPETAFGGDFESEADYKDPYVLNMIEQSGWVLWPLVRYHYDTINYDLTYPSPPSKQNWLGLDDQGRDVFARLIYGLRISLAFALTLTSVISAIALVTGTVQGYLGGWVDLIGQRLTEIWGAIPVMFVVMIVASILNPGFATLILVLALFGWHYLAQLIRAEVLKTRQLEYVQSALIAGVSDFRIMLRHVLPNALITTLSTLPFIFAGSLGSLITLDFLGFGLPVGYPSLGELIAQGKNNLHAPWLGMTGCGAILFVITLVVLVGEAVQEWLSPFKEHHHAQR